ncbi:MAG: hypothetical protein S4CHLAM81_07970 [Chlamydiales bacterium]|nr:hypothetical protein [Chlamydiales bacterium]MCH9635579.1 hypothetical protein [Chlamydiales bacterium]
MPKFIWKHTPLKVKGTVGSVIALTLITVAILGTVGKLPIPSSGQWPLYLAGGSFAVCSIMAFVFNHQQAS